MSVVGAICVPAAASGTEHEKGNGYLAQNKSQLNWLGACWLQKNKASKRERDAELELFKGAGITLAE